MLAKLEQLQDELSLAARRAARGRRAAHAGARRAPGAGRRGRPDAGDRAGAGARRLRGRRPGARARARAGTRAGARERPPRRATAPTRPAPASSRSTWRSAAPRARRPRATWPRTSRSRTRTRCSTTSTPRSAGDPARAARGCAGGWPRSPTSGARRADVLGPEHDDAAGRRRGPRRHGRHAAAHGARARDRPGARPPARRARAVGGGGGPRLRRRPARALGAARLREVRARARRPRRRAHAREGDGLQAWTEALAASDYSRFRDSLARHIELRHAYVGCFEGHAHPYDVLLDDFEPGLTTAELRPMFAELREALVPLVAATGDPRAAAQRRRLPRAVQRRVAARRRARAARLGRLRPRPLAPGPVAAPVRAEPRADRRAPDHQVRRAGLRRRAVLGAARVRPRALRGLGRPAR